MALGPGYHHHKSQWFVNGKVISGAAGAGLAYNSETVFPKEPQKTKPLSMQDTYRPPSKHYPLKNLHSSDFEVGGISTGDPRNLREKYSKKQHFVRGQIPGGSASNRMIYGTDELLHQARIKDEARNPSGFLYGTEAATRVGKQAPAPRPNNALWLEQKTEKDAAKHKILASTQDEFLSRHYEEKAKIQQAAREEQRKDWEDLKSYAPWGKQGAGAPRSDAHMTTNVKKLVQEPGQNFGGRAGGGAPIRSQSGTVHAAYMADPELRFPKHAARPTVEPVLRYGGRDENYKKELESGIEDSRTRKQVQRQRSFEDELRHINTDPFGRQGGGAPIKSSKGTIKAGFPTTLSQNIQELRQVNQRHPHAYNQTHQNTGYNGSDHETRQYEPWGRGHGNPPMFDNNGRMIKPTQKGQGNDLEGIGIAVGRPGGGAPNVDRSGNMRYKKGQTLNKTSTGQTIQRDFSPKGDTYDPFGRPGAGAPVKDLEGEIQTRTAGRVMHDTNDLSPSVRKDSRAKNEYLTTLQKQTEEAKEKKKAEHNDILTSEKDVASWLRTGAVGQLNYDPVTKEIVAQKKQTSDVTSQVFNIRRQKNEKSHEYHVDLETQARERHQQRQNSQDQQRIKSVEHMKTMDNTWGRPGAGAPLGKEHVDFARKQKLGLDPADSSYTYREA